MRPTRLELSGFASYREPTVLDLEGVDLFVLSGPTGSGKCLPAGALVFDGKSGQRVPIEQFVRERRPSTLGPVDGRFQSVPVTEWHDLGEKDTVFVTLENGARLHAATTHPVLTDEGCAPTGALKPGDWVAQARSLPEVGPSLINADEAFVLGCLLGDGTVTARQHLGFTNTDESVIEALQDALGRIVPGVELRASKNSVTYRFANRLRGDDRRAYVLALFERLEDKGIDMRSVLGWNHTRVRRTGAGFAYSTLETIEEEYGIDLYEEKCILWANLALCDWLVQMGALGHGALTKRLPVWITLQPEEVLWPLIAGLIATDGTVNRHDVEFYTSSEDLARDVQLLSIRLGMSPTLSMRKTAYADGWRVRFDVSSVLRMAQHIAIPGPKGARLGDIAADHARKGRKYLADRLPPSMTRSLPTTSPDGKHYRTRNQLESCGMSRELFAIWGGDRALWDNDYRWSRVVSIEPAGRHRCYDLTVDTAEHLYVSESFIVHNSSIIDAMTFALYGSVPRYDNKNLVAPVISQGQLEARVRLDFAVADGHYRATRVVRRTRTGATTKEARLEKVTPSGATTLAGTADELTAEVEQLLGLTFDHFTTCVVLPQGAFQAFMHAKPKERQDLLVELLDLDIYRRVAAMAREKATRDEMEVELLERQLTGELADATAEQLEQARTRTAALEALAERITSARPKLEAITEEGHELRAAEREAAVRRELVASVRVPDGVAELSGRLREATDGLQQAEAALTEASRAREEVEGEADGLPDAGALRDLAEAIAATPSFAEREAAARTALAAAEDAVTAARAAHEEASAATTRARAGLEEARRGELAHTLVEGLAAGDDCPVCSRPLDAVPDHGDAAATEAARAQLQRAETAESEAATGVQRAETGRGRAEAELTGATDRRAEHDRTTAERAARLDLPLDADAVGRRIAEVTAVTGRVATAREAERQARRNAEAAKESVAAVAAARDEGWRVFDALRDRVAVLEPPAVPRDDLAGAWAELAVWAEARVPELDRAAATAKEAVEDATRRYRAAQDELWQACEDEGLERTPGADPRDVCVDALNRARHRLEGVQEALRKVEEVGARRDSLRREARVARELGNQLNARRFEQWLLNRALRRLVVGASVILNELSQGAYSLALDDGNAFQVIDHRNADEVRSARTLSGGETFLASLALALALSEHVADLAAQGSARLDALFIDEGFGTLDPDALDTVATAIEELGSRGRMVGIVTHVQDLAERLPVRYEVRKTANSSTVTRVDA
ncbi:MAG: AAA family ATPase [Actinobacteria bacterium]|nr:AAA family ATPase [Actinomycetota bacterium]